MVISVSTIPLKRLQIYIWFQLTNTLVFDLSIPTFKYVTIRTLEYYSNNIRIFVILLILS